VGDYNNNLIEEEMFRTIIEASKRDAGGLANVSFCLDPNEC
jgi:hypothetical protein